MSRRWVWTGLLLGSLALPTLSAAEPLTFDQAANVTGLAGIEVGADFDYSYEKFEQDMVGTVENSITEIPVFVRVGLPVLEAKLTVPYGSLQSNIDAASNENYSAIQNVGIGLKTGLLALPIFNFALGLNTVFPTAEPEKYIFGDGLTIDPYLAADIDIMILKLHANLGYTYRAAYEVDMGGGDVKVKPGDAIRYAAGAEIPLSDSFFLMAELVGISYQEVKMDEITLPDTAGSTFEFVPGLRLQSGIFKAKVGVAIPLENPADRPEFAPRSDWRIIGGLSLLLGI